MPIGENKWFSIVIISLAQVFCLSLWFSATAIIPSLEIDYSLSDTQTTLLSSSVILGFIFGGLVSAIFGFADRIPPKLFFTSSATFAAFINFTFLFFEPNGVFTLIIRFLTGFALAGIYPIGMKMIITWSKGDTGLLVGLLVGGLTLGSAFPHLLNALGGLDWRFTIKATSFCALFGAVIIYFLPLGPNQTKSPPLNPKAFLKIWTNKPVRLTSFGYFGHMWELYAMWVWIGTFMLAHFQIIWGDDEKMAYLMANISTFIIIGSGAIGCLLGGYLADKHGRTLVTIVALVLSGTSALAIGFAFGENTLLLLIIASIWGISIVADSAQFSSAVIELSDPEYQGTMLTLQTSIGFSITLITIHIIPIIVNLIGWEFAFIVLAPGAYIGAWAMYSLRKHPKSYLLANGKK